MTGLARTSPHAQGALASPHAQAATASSRAWASLVFDLAHPPVLPSPCCLLLTLIWNLGSLHPFEGLVQLW